jgi:hypothetical protein
VKRLFLTLAVVLLSSCGVNAPHAQIAPQVTADPAADLVHNFRLGSNLESMANSVAASTHTNGTILPGSATSEIHKLLPKYQPQWDANLAKAYSNHLAAQELRSLAKRWPILALR